MNFEDLLNIYADHVHSDAREGRNVPSPATDEARLAIMTALADKDAGPSLVEQALRAVNWMRKTPLPVPSDVFEGLSNAVDARRTEAVPTPVTPHGAFRHDINNLVQQLKNVVHAHAGRATVAEAVGALELVKHEIIQENAK